MKAKFRVPLYISLFAIVFLNGFETGGYQACLFNISREFGLNDADMGTLASVQLIAVLIAPIIFGYMADRKGKKRVLLLFLATLIMGCLWVFFSKSAFYFCPGIFLIGFSISSLQYVSIAALADAYPATGKKKMGVLTAMYALGAFVSPLVCKLASDNGISWRSLFILITILSLIIITSVIGSDFSQQEISSKIENDMRTHLVLSGVILLCVIMFVYVGFESGYAFFLNSYIKESFDGRYSYLALSMFWLAMIPSRIICGYIGEKSKLVLVISAAAVSAGTIGMIFTGSEWVPVLLSFIIGFFGGMVYPSVLNRLNDFAIGKTATASGMITAATGLGGAAITAALGNISQGFGIKTGFMILAIWIAMDIVLGLILASKKVNAAEYGGESNGR